MDDNVLSLLIPFLKEIVEKHIDVRNVLTERIKESVLYRQLDEGRALPSVEEMMAADSRALGSQQPAAS